MRTALTRLKRPLLYVMGPAYVVAGLLHFVVPDLYAQIIPPALPAPLALVYLSGVAEVAVERGLLWPRRRPYAAWATIALLVAIFQGMPGGGDPSALVRWGRLPLQGVLLLWAYWYTGGCDKLT